MEPEVDTAIKEKPTADLRDHLAEERTFRAWIRTGIASMAFGFVLAHPGLFEDEPHLAQHASGVPPHELSLWFGAAATAVGVTVNVFSAWRFMRLAGRLSGSQLLRRSMSRQGVVVVTFVGLLGLIMTIYMIWALPQPPHTLHT
jgi:putative membrane protein